MLPVVADLTALLARLDADERARQAELVGLETRLREFEDVERPAYTSWLRRELGPAIVALERRQEELRARRATLVRVTTIAELEGWQPREALYVILHPRDVAPRRDRMDPDAVAARRRAKVERKRADRKAARRAAASAGPRETVRADARARLVTVYRAVARRLHPDAIDRVGWLDASRVKTLWVEAHAAYVAGDLARLLAIATWLDAGGSAQGGPIVPPSLSERYERLRALSRSARTLEGRLADLGNDPAWGFSRTSARERRRLRMAAVRTLDDELDRVEAALREIDDELRAIGSPRPPRRRHWD